MKEHLIETWKTSETDDEEVYGFNANYTGKYTELEYDDTWAETIAWSLNGHSLSASYSDDSDETIAAQFSISINGNVWTAGAYQYIKQ